MKIRIFKIFGIIFGSKQPIPIFLLFLPLVKKILFSIFDFYINASLHVALAVVALGLVTLKQLKLPINWDVINILLCGTIISYNFVKFGSVLVKKKKLTYKFLSVLILCIFCGLSFFISFLCVPKSAKIILISAIILSVLYCIPLLPHHKNFRSLSSIKIGIVALCWTLLTVIFPITMYRNHFFFNDFIMSVQQFLFVIVLILPFDIRDLKTDAKELKTFPQRIGIKRTKILGLSLLLIFITLLVFRENLNLYDYFTYFFISVITSLFLLLAKENSPKYYCSFYVEAIPIVWFLFYLIPHLNLIL